jgi:predicted nucleic acid-binding protein
MTFVDSSFWIALTLRRDARHEQAVALLRAHGDGPLLTSNHVRGETWTFLNRKDGPAVASRFLERIDRWQRLTIMFVAEQVEREALRWLRRHDEREYSFVDATSFALMRSLKIRQALAFDGDFAAAGFVELRS